MADLLKPMIQQGEIVWKLFFYVEKGGESMLAPWVKNIMRQHQGHMKEIKDHRETMKSYRDKREAPGRQMRRMKLTAAEKQKLKAKISENSGQRLDEKTRRK